MRAKLAAALGALTVWATASAQAQQVSLVFAGDTTLDDDAGALISRGGDPLAPFAALFASADLRIANLECVVATTGQPAAKKDRKSTRLNSSHTIQSRMPSSA